MSELDEKLAILGGRPICQRPLEPPAWPPLSRATAARLKEVYLSGQWSFHSPAEQEFAQAFADYHGAKHGVFMANGTVTLQCALKACGVGKGDEVIVPAMTWMATAMVAHYVGATPVFVDVEPTTLCMDPAQVEAAVTDRTRAIIPVHLYGSTADLEAILHIADRHDLVVIEDCAHVHGGKWDGRGVGSWGKVGSFSFQQSKTMSSGEGGICITDDDELAARIFRAKHIGYMTGTAQGQASQGPPPGEICHNFRSTAFHAVILSDQLAELPDRIERYDRNAQRLQRRLADVSGVRIQSRGRLANPQSYYYLVFIFDEGPLASVPRQGIKEAMGAEGLYPGFTHGPVYQHPLFNLLPGDYRIFEGRCPVAETVGTERALVLPHQMLGMDEDVIDTIGRIVAKVAEHGGALLATSSECVS